LEGGFGGRDKDIWVEAELRSLPATVKPKKYPLGGLPNPPPRRCFERKRAMRTIHDQMVPNKKRQKMIGIIRASKPQT